jgi:toxin ParE1/3/4
VRTFELIAAYPQIARERVEFVPPARVHAYRAHVIFYLIENEDVLILRVAGARQDWASQL